MSWELIVFVAAAGAVVLGCLLPARWLPLLPHDKLLHFVAFAGLSTLALLIEPAWAGRVLWLLGLLLAGLAIEILQKLVPGRSFCWRDMGANTAGIAAATLVFGLIQVI
ncbi:VanZ family protein [Massilia sp. YIM B02443]|uniref:VanZ family protein n=1 Tax=Massilia sp. YIM B02443 TaxID=3050127 RepID=UPI0025B6EAAF|nr:VanZ family protein [Massilia sp. YIM B02443]MDN4035475.1 VanZ family protein [Massilia sp. YIM B02443]